MLLKTQPLEHLQISKSFSKPHKSVLKYLTCTNWYNLNFIWRKIQSLFKSLSTRIEHCITQTCPSELCEYLNHYKKHKPMVKKSEKPPRRRFYISAINSNDCLNNVKYECEVRDEPTDYIKVQQLNELLFEVLAMRSSPDYLYWNFKLCVWTCVGHATAP